MKRRVVAWWLLCAASEVSGAPFSSDAVGVAFFPRPSATGASAAALRCILHSYVRAATFDGCFALF